jgi:hypothetical protein
MATVNDYWYGLIIQSGDTFCLALSPIADVFLRQVKRQSSPYWG